MDAFAAALAGSKAVINCRLDELQRLASADWQLYASYYERLKGGVQAPYGDAWDKLRKVADSTLFPFYEDKIHFAALSLDGIGAQSYGECSLVLREPMIAVRTSVFEDNSAVLLGKRRQRLRPGFRAPWADRTKLCVAKLAARMDDGRRHDRRGVSGSATLAGSVPGEGPLRRGPHLGFFVDPNL